MWDKNTVSNEQLRSAAAWRFGIMNSIVHDPNNSSHHAFECRYPQSRSFRSINYTRNRMLRWVYKCSSLNVRPTILHICIIYSHTWAWCTHMRMGIHSRDISGHIPIAVSAHRPFVTPRRAFTKFGSSRLHFDIIAPNVVAFPAAFHHEWIP